MRCGGSSADLPRVRASCYVDAPLLCRRIRCSLSALRYNLLDERVRCLWIWIGHVVLMAAVIVDKDRATKL